VYNINEDITAESDRIMTDTRQKLVETTKELLWERGYDAMSPNLVLERSGIGKGSMYHHFKGKKALASAAIHARSEELIAEFDAEFDIALPLMDRFERYLCKPRDGLKGCRLGRLVSDISVTEDELRQPISALFAHVEQAFTQALLAAQARGEIELKADADALAATLVASIQGAFILSRAHSDTGYMDKVAQGAMQLLKASIS